jgi:hypothetical protein
MKYIYLAVTFWFNLFVFLQTKDQLKPIYGQLISDSINVQNVTIVNRTSKLETTSSANGSFSINAKVKDTLYFNSPNIVTMQYVVEAVDFAIDLKVNVYPKSTMLDEMIIYRHNVTGVLGYDSRSLPTYYRNIEQEVRDKVSGLDLTSEQQNSRILVNTLNETLPGSIKNRPYDVNFVAIGKAVGKLFKKNPKTSEHQKLQDEIYIIYGKDNLADQLEMDATELDYYLDYLLANKLIDKNKVEKNDSLTLLEILVKNKTAYYTYLKEEIK